MRIIIRPHSFLLYCDQRASSFPKVFDKNFHLGHVRRNTTSRCVCNWLLAILNVRSSEKLPNSLRRDMGARQKKSPKKAFLKCELIRNSLVSKKASSTKLAIFSTKYEAIEENQNLDSQAKNNRLILDVRIIICIKLY